jgi:hypothetical protein
MVVEPVLSETGEVRVGSDLPRLFIVKPPHSFANIHRHVLGYDTVNSTDQQYARGLSSCVTRGLNANGREFLVMSDNMAGNVECAAAAIRPAVFGGYCNTTPLQGTRRKPLFEWAHTDFRHKQQLRRK